MQQVERTPKVSVIIVCHNDGRWLLRCLESLRAQTLFDDVEVIIADNASSDGTDQLARELIAGWPRAMFLPTGGDHGFGVACNRAAERATGRYLFFLNPDLWLETDCLQQLYETAERAQAAAAGGTVLEYDDDTLQARSCDGFDLFGNAMPARTQSVIEPLFAIACFQFIRRDVFLRVGMMDERFFMYGEELDMAWRIWIAGERIVHAPNARIHHRGAVNVNPGAQTRPAEHRTSVQKRFLANRNRLLCLAKNCQHVLLLLLLPCAATILAEGLVTWAATRKWSLARASSLDALVSFARMLGHIRAERRRIAGFRKRSDWWMLRFLRLGFGRWAEVSRALKHGYPKFA